MTSGAFLTALNDDCVAVQNAISEKVGNAVHHVATFFIAMIVALWKGWKLTLVMVAMMPLVAIAGAVTAKALSYGTSLMAHAYGEANTASSEAISNIRTVASFQAEETVFHRYSELLSYPRRVGIRLSAFSGMAEGAVNCVVTATSSGPLRLLLKRTLVELCHLCYKPHPNLHDESENKNGLDLGHLEIGPSVLRTYSCEGLLF
jgi:ABC-type multidrug transport system fused ATPase/permease subunit